MSHTPVLLDEVIEALQVTRGKKYIDATVGQLGHFNKIVELGGTVLGIDYDAQQIERAHDHRSGKHMTLVHGNFADIEEIAKKHDFYPADGVLFDLGVSYEQLKSGNKGLSFKNEEESLDMRLNESAEMTAAEILRTFSQEDLYLVFARYSEEPLSDKIASAVVSFRKQYKLEKVADLNTVIESVDNQNKKILPRVYQALRIAVNHEFENLQRGLTGAKNIIRKGGRIVVITFQSLEDRKVKQFFQKNSEELVERSKIKLKSKKSFERSAIVRIAEKL